VRRRRKDVFLSVSAVEVTFFGDKVSQSLDMRAYFHECCLLYRYCKSSTVLPKVMAYRRIPYSSIVNLEDRIEEINTNRDGYVLK
jgi:hypothetical protein